MRDTTENGQALMLSAAGPSASSYRRAWARIVRFERDWSAIGPAVFSVLAVALLIYNHVLQSVTDLVFWLGIALVAAVFTWMLQNHRRQSKSLEGYDRRDALTGLPNRLQLQVDVADVQASSQDQRTLVLLEVDGVAAYRDRFGFESGDQLLRDFAGEMSSAVEQLGGAAYRIDGSQFCALVPGGSHQLGEIVAAISVYGYGGHGDDQTPINRSYGGVTLPDEAPSLDIAMQLAGQRLTARKQRRQRSAKRQAHDVLMAVLKARRPELRTHLRDVAFRSISIARRLGFDHDQLDDVVFAAELQDIGLLTVPEAVLEKESQLSKIEFELIHGHPAAGAGIISAAPAMASVATLVRSSHESFDGSGYPDGLAGDAIPLGSRVISVSVTFAALTAERPYRPARSPEDALAELRHFAGDQFDPRVVEALAEDIVGEVSPPGRGTAAPSSIGAGRSDGN